MRKAIMKTKNFVELMLLIKGQPTQMYELYERNGYLFRWQSRLLIRVKAVRMGDFEFLKFQSRKIPEVKRYLDSKIKKEDE